MNYNQPLQHLAYFGSKTSKAVFIRSTVNVLAKQGTTFSRSNIITNKPGKQALNTGNTELPDYIIEYTEVTDYSRTDDGIFQDVVDIKLFSVTSFPIKDEVQSIKTEIKDYLTQITKNVLKVMVKVISSGPTGVVTTTITEKSDIEIE